MKKAVTFLSLVISFLFIANFYNVSATSASLPGEYVNPLDLIGLQDLGYGLIGGAQFTFEDSKYVIEDYSALSAEGKLEAERQKIKEFLLDYEAARGIGEYGFTDGALYQGQSYYTTAFTQNANRILEEYSISSQNVDYAMGISPFKFADWAQYNRYWVNRYSDSFVPEADDPPTVTIPSDYSYMNNANIFPYSGLNLLGFTGNWQNIYDNGIVYWNYPLYSVTLYMGSLDHNGVAINTDIFQSTLMTIRINSSSSPVTVSYENFNRISALHDQWYNCYSFKINSYVSSTDTLNIYFSYGGNANTPAWLQTNFNDLSSALQYIYSHYANFNLYVDGDCWLVGGNAPANPFIPSFPDVIENDYDLAYDIPFPNTDTYEGNFDITSVFDALREAIIGASDTDSTTSGTLTGEKVVDTYDGVDIDVQDKVVDLVSTKVFAGTLEDTTTDRLPDIVVPPLAVHNGLGGVTVLAKYIDATQCILPEEIVTSFWGIFFILIILGLIKNLHR